MHVFPKLGDIAITELTQIDIKECLSPIWKKQKRNSKKGFIAFEYCYKACSSAWHRCGSAIGTKSKSFIRKIYSKCSKYSGYAMERSA
ncbi:hypothetical protein [Bartonella callosciuri]|uniref:hypothetical protein n=1 Tax=Bartonella callosciuri TaxID=686223 RepID=UPI003CCDD16B